MKQLFIDETIVLFSDDLSPSDHLFDLALKSPMAVVRKGLLLNKSSRFISKSVRKS